jgi:CheY-like chemotaxis protein
MTSAPSRTAPHVVHTRPYTPPTRAPQPGQALLVDDDPSIRELVCDLLTQAGYAVTTAENGAIALALLGRLAHRVDVILLDRQMPVMDGTGLARALRQHGSIVPIIAFTGTVEGEEWAAQIQAAAFLAKPFEVDDLLAAVARFCPPRMTPRAPRETDQTSAPFGWPNGRMAC